MRSLLSALCVVVFSALAIVPVSSDAGSPREYDDCDAGFIAFVGASTYQFSPSHDGDLGHVRLYTVLSYQRAAAFEDFGRASMGENTDNLPAATGATWNYTTDNVNNLAQTPGAINPGQTNGL